MSNIDSNQVNQTRSLLEGAKSIMIATGANPTLDNVAAGLALYLALSTAGKQVSFVCPTPMTVEFNHLIGVDKIGNSLNNSSGRNLIISFPYEEGSIEKVSYNIENNTFNLVIEPREGYPQITQDLMRYSYSGGNTDVIVTIGTPRLADLNHFYSSNQNLFHEKPIINIDSNGQNARYGKINLVDPSLSSTSELMVTVLSQLGLAQQEDIATNLLAGISDGSANFSSALTSAMTFEAAAICLKHGARKPSVPYPPANSQFTQPPPSPVNLPQMTQTPLAAFGKPIKSPFPRQAAPPTSPSKPSIPGPFRSKSQPVKPPTQPQPQVPPMKESTHPETPPDWLKPKIYKGSTLL